MKKILLGSSVLLAAGVVTTPVFAADGIKLSLGGFFRTAVDVNIDDHSAGDLGNKRYNDGVFSDAEVYFGGFQMGVSWSPNGAHESAGVTGGHAGMPAVVNGEQRNILDAYAVFKKDFDGWGLQWGGGGSWALSMGGTPSATQKKGEDYQTGLNLSFGNLSVGSTFG